VPAEAWWSSEVWCERERESGEGGGGELVFSFYDKNEESLGFILFSFFSSFIS
jgi:hypothetical protein